MPQLTWVGSPNEWQGSLSDVIALVVHTEVGTEAGTVSEFENASAQLSAHYGVSLSGHVDQFVNLTDAAWANGGPNPGSRWTLTSDNPNLHTISIETEDLGDADNTPVSDEQYSSIIYLFKNIIQVKWPTIKYLVAHRVINPQHSCPGNRWLNGKFQQLGKDLNLTVII